MTPEDETKLTKLFNSISEMTKKVDTLNETVNGLKTTVGSHDVSMKTLQSAIEETEFKAFQKKLNATNRTDDIAKKLFQEAKVSPNAWEDAHPDLMLENSSTPEDLKLKGQSVAVSRAKARDDMVASRDKILNGGA